MYLPCWDWRLTMFVNGHQEYWAPASQKVIFSEGWCSHSFGNNTPLAVVIKYDMLVPLLLTWNNLISTVIRNQMASEGRGEKTYPFPDFNGCIVEAFYMYTWFHPSF